jgi:hypothetical protein
VTEVVIPLVVRDPTPDDLPSCAWSGSALHLASIATMLERARRGEVDYLAVCPPSGLPVGVGGIGTVLIRAAERRILARGLHRAELGVEESNPRARALYDRLGYVAYGRAPDSWDEQASDGTIVRYATMCTLMRKELS